MNKPKELLPPGTLSNFVVWSPKIRWLDSKNSGVKPGPLQPIHFKVEKNREYGKFGHPQSVCLYTDITKMYLHEMTPLHVQDYDRAMKILENN